MGESEARSARLPSQAAASARSFLIAHDAESCSACWGCVRHCPAHAISVLDGVARIVEERCVLCGACVKECGNAARAVRDDLAAVRELLASGRTVVAVLATEYLAALHPLSAEEVERSLAAAGFSAVESTVLGEELIAAAYEQVHGRADDVLPRLRSTCPVAVEWVRRFHPQLTAALVPLVPPYVAQARLVRALYPDDVAIVYVSPCWARKDEALSPRFDGAVDVAIGFDELRTLLAERPAPAPLPAGALLAPMRRPTAPKDLSLTDGFPRRTLLERDMTDRELVAVRGLADIDRLLRAITRGEVAPGVVDMLACEGCADGPCVNDALSVFAKRNIIAAERERQAPPPVGSRPLLGALPAIDVRRSFDARPALSRVPSADEVDAVLAAGEFMTRAETIDCGACGYGTCVELAAAICLGNADWGVCLPLARRRLERERDALAATVREDAATGLPDSRAFEERLAHECARAVRYGSALALVLVALDGAGAGPAADATPADADALAATAAGRLAGILRATDVVARVAPLRFALLLPATGKTEAFAVAEKVRLVLGAADAPAEASAGLAIGVAALSETVASAAALLAAADGALARAHARGGGRVELAAG